MARHGAAARGCQGQGVEVTVFSRLRRRQAAGETIAVAVVGAGFVGRGLVYQLGLTPGMRTAVVVNRTPDRAVEALTAAGEAPGDVVVTEDASELAAAVEDGRPAVTTSHRVAANVAAVDVVVEATGAVEYGAIVARDAIDADKHVVSVNFETDATVGPLLKALADERGVVYTGSDGDQPGVMARMVDYVEGIGLDVVAAVNCKGFMDVHATPETIAIWAERQKTSLPMTTAFTDGTKMNIENACVANATGLVPDRIGMHGVKTSMRDALTDFRSVLTRGGVVEYTLGGDFGGGIFVIGSSQHPEQVQHYLNYLKMGDGPWYLFYRPWHLVHFETPITIAEVVLDGEATVAPRGEPIADVIAFAKRDLVPGEVLDGIGGYTSYGQIASMGDAQGYLAAGLTDHVTMTRPVAADSPIPLDAVELDGDSELVTMRRQQDQHFAPK